MVGWARGSFLGLSESVAFSVGFKNVHSVGEAIEQSPGETFRTKDLGPVLEWEIGSNHKALTLIGSADHFK